MKPSNTCALRRLTRGLVACAITLAMLGCGGGGGGGGDTGAAGDGTGGSEIPAAPALKLLPGRLGLAIGDNGALFATGAAAATTWQSSDATVAAVDQLGRVKALAKGSAVITATSAAAVATSTVTVYRTDGVTPDPTSESLIADALAAKRIDAETALTYGIFSIFGDERLPAAFEGAPSTVPQHLLLRQMATTIASLSPATQAVLRPFLTPPIYPGSWYAGRLGLDATPAQKQTAAAKTEINCTVGIAPSLYARVSTAHFNVYYIVFGAAALQQENASAAAAASLVASLIEEVYDSETALIDPKQRLDDSAEACNGGDGKYDIYYGPFGLGRVAAWTTGYSLPTGSTASACASRPSYMMLNSLSGEFLGAAAQPTESRLLVKSILAHEFLHALQFSMNRQTTCADTEWFDEATAQWAMDHVVPTIPQGFPGEFGAETGLIRTAPNYQKSGNVLAEYLYSDHLISIEKPGVQPRLNGYADYLFFQYLARTRGASTIKAIFDAMAAGRNSVEAIAAAVDMKAAWPEFAKTLWIGYDEKVLDYWAKEDEYRFGLAAVFAQVPTTLSIDQALKDKQKTTLVDQKGGKSAKFDLLAQALDFGASSYELEPRSIFYEHLKASDAAVRAVIFHNPFAGDPAAGFIKLQAVRKVGGQWQAPEDWTTDAFKTMCLDKKDERVEELLLIVSNSQADRATETPFRFTMEEPMRLSTSNVGCWQWKGTASLTTQTVFGYTTVESFDGAFDRQRILSPDPADMLVGLDVFVANMQGTVSYSISGPVTGTNCTISGTGSGKVRALSDGNMIVSYLGLGAVPLPLDRMTIGSGVTTVPAIGITSRCGGGAPSTSVLDKDTHWLPLPTDGVAISADGLTISGTWTRTDSEGIKTSVWNFKAVRE